jgi:hypothetical protein
MRIRTRKITVGKNVGMRALLFEEKKGEVCMFKTSPSIDV